MSLCSFSSNNHGIACDCFTKWKCHFPGFSQHQTLQTPTGLSPLLLGEKEMTEKQKLKFLSKWEPTQTRFDTCLEAKYKCLLAEHHISILCAPGTCQGVFFLHMVDVSPFAQSLLFLYIVFTVWSFHSPCWGADIDVVSSVIWSNDMLNDSIIKRLHVWQGVSISTRIWQTSVKGCLHSLRCDTQFSMSGCWYFHA